MDVAAFLALLKREYTEHSDPYRMGESGHSDPIILKILLKDLRCRLQQLYMYITHHLIYRPMAEEVMVELRERIQLVRQGLAFIRERLGAIGTSRHMVHCEEIGHNILERAAMCRISGEKDFVGRVRKLHHGMIEYGKEHLLGEGLCDKVRAMNPTSDATKDVDDTVQIAQNLLEHEAACIVTDYLKKMEECHE